MSRILKRPMFRTGGSTNEGIMHRLVNRKGYELGTRTEEIVAAMDKYAPLPKSRFPMGQIGLNLISGEYAGDSLLQNIAGSARDPYSQWTAADDARRQALAKRKASAVGVAISEESAREMQMLKNLSKDERIMMEKRALLLSERLNIPFADALKMELYKKTEDPRHTRQRKIDEGIAIYRKGGTFERDSAAIAKAKATFDVDRDTIIDNNPNLEFDPYDPFYSPDRSSYQIGIIYYNPGLDQYIRYDGSDADPKFVDITETIVK